MSFSRDTRSTRLNVAFICNETRGVYTPIPQRLRCEFYAPTLGARPARENGVLNGDTLHGVPPTLERVSALRLFAEGDPYAPDAHDGEAYSLDGYAPECAYEMAGAFLGCITSGYGPEVTVHCGSHFHTHAPRWQKGPGQYWIETPPAATEPAERVQLVLERHARRGIQTKGGAFAGTLPGILVLPVIVVIEADEVP